MKKHTYLFILVFITTVHQALPDDCNNNEQGNSPILEAINLEIFHSEKGVVKVKVYTKKALRYKNNDIVLPQGIDAILYNDDSSEQSRLTADHLLYISKEKTCTLKGNIVIKNCKKNQQLRTDKLNYNINTEEFYTDTPVKVDDQGNILLGDGLKATQDLTDYNIINPHGHLDIADATP